MQSALGAFGWTNWAYLGLTALALAAMTWSGWLGDSYGGGPDKAAAATTAFFLWLGLTGAFVLGNLVALGLALLRGGSARQALIGALLPVALAALMGLLL